MTWNQAIFEVISLRSFSSVWYWIVLAVTWSSVSHYVIGVPYDLIQRARRDLSGQAYLDVLDLVRINVNRLLHISKTAGMILIAFSCFVLTSLALMAFYYDAELAQAIFLIALPLTGVGLLSLATARKLYDVDPEGEVLFKMLLRHRLWTQIIGMFAIFFTAMYGMYQNLDLIRHL